MKNAILSVSDKTNIVEFARNLIKNDYKVYSTGGTKKALEEANVEVYSVSELTDFPEIMDGRVKTLHPGVHGGILANRSIPEHLSALEEQGIDLIDLVVVNLYPFKETIKKENVTEEEAIENIDIGGPTMLRAAAKNFKFVTTVVNPDDYEEVIRRIENNELDENYRKSLMIKVFKHTNDYDNTIVEFFNDASEELRYGENPQQNATFIKTSQEPNTLAGAKQLHGKALSFNNIKDADATLSLIKKFEQPAAVAVKHMNPCGVGVGETIEQAYEYAYEADSQSIFGGIVALNRPVTKALAENLHSIF